MSEGWYYSDDDEIDNEAIKNGYISEYDLVNIAELKHLVTYWKEKYEDVYNEVRDELYDEVFDEVYNEVCKQFENVDIKEAEDNIYRTHKMQSYAALNTNLKKKVSKLEKIIEKQKADILRLENKIIELSKNGSNKKTIKSIWEKLLYGDNKGFKN